MIVFKTQNPTALLEMFTKMVGEGSISSWRSINKSYTVNSSQWTRRAFVDFNVHNQELHCFISRDDTKLLSREVFVFYQVFLVETFMRNLFMYFDSSTMTTNGFNLEIT
jgi:hypothetical protein